MSTSIPTRQSFNWRMLRVLCVLNVFGSIVMTPYARLLNMTLEPTSSTAPLAVFIV